MRVRLKNPVLLCGTQACEEGKDLDIRRILRPRDIARRTVAEVIVKSLLNIADIALAGQENQDIPGALAAQFINRVADRRLKVDLDPCTVALHSERVIRVL